MLKPRIEPKKKHVRFGVIDPKDLHKLIIEEGRVYKCMERILAYREPKQKRTKMLISYLEFSFDKINIFGVSSLN